MSDLDDVLSDEPQAEPQTEEPQPEEVKAEEPTPEPVDDPRDKQIAGLQAALSEVRGELRAYRQQPQPRPEPVTMPDVLEDQAGYAQALQAQFMQTVQNMEANFSERLARKDYGSTFVDEAYQAAQAAGEIDKFRRSKDPWGDLAEWHKNQKIAQEIGGDLEGYEAKLREKLTAEIKAQMVAENVTAKAAQPAPSLASQPNLGSRAAPAWSGPDSLDDILSG